MNMGLLDAEFFPGQFKSVLPVVLNEITCVTSSLFWTFEVFNSLYILEVFC